jgi:Xaa-Pro aminopeptidase
MRKAAKIAAEAHVRAMRTRGPGMNEHEIEAESLHTFRRHGAVPSYEPIVGGGVNGCVLHYRANNAPLHDGDLLLIDAGAEFQCYASDITRTFPVNGASRPNTRAVRHRARRAARPRSQVRPGRLVRRYHEAAVRTITRGLVKLGLLKAAVEKNLREQSYRASTCTRPGTGSASTCTTSATTASTASSASSSRHGRDGRAGHLHRAGCEAFPAKWRGIGIRIEDDVVVTRDDPK